VLTTGPNHSCFLHYIDRNRFPNSLELIIPLPALLKGLLVCPQPVRLSVIPLPLFRTFLSALDDDNRLNYHTWPSLGQLQTKEPNVLFSLAYFWINHVPPLWWTASGKFVLLACNYYAFKRLVIITIIIDIHLLYTFCEYSTYRNSWLSESTSLSNSSRTWLYCGDVVGLDFCN
jgi:hypothetical protein